MKKNLQYLFQVGSAFVTEYRRRIKRSGSERTMESLWVRRLHVHKTTDDIIYSVLCTSFAINVDTHVSILSLSSGKIWAYGRSKVSLTLCMSLPEVNTTCDTYYVKEKQRMIACGQIVRRRDKNTE